MQFTKLEQSGALINGVAIDIGAFTDPVDVRALAPDALLYTHRHADHLDVALAASLGLPAFAPADAAEILVAAELDATVMCAGETRTLGKLTVTPFAVDHGPISEPIDNLGYALATASGVRVLVVGDAKSPIDELPEGNYDVALIPIGGSKVFAAHEADAELRRIGFCGIAVPCHYDRNTEALALFDALAAAAPYTVAVLGAGETLTLEGKVVA